MPPSSRQRRKFWLLSIVGTAAFCVVVMFVIKDGRLVLAEYYSYRLDRAVTEADAKPWLDLLAADAKRPGASEAFLSKLGTAHQWLTCWFFQRIVLEELKNDHPLFSDFAQRLERDEALLGCWIHFVRWAAEGTRLGGDLPFVRLLVHDEALGYKRDTETQLPALIPLDRGRPVPKLPLPGWKGPAPPAPSPLKYAPDIELLLPPGISLTER